MAHNTIEITTYTGMEPSTASDTECIGVTWLYGVIHIYYHSGRYGWHDSYTGLAGYWTYAKAVSAAKSCLINYLGLG